MRTTKNKIGAAALALLLLFALLLCSCAGTGTPPEVEAVYSYHTELQQAYLADAYGNVALYADGTKELSRPAPVTIDLSDYDGYKEIEVSDRFDMKGAKTYSIVDRTAEIYNLTAGKVYYYRVVKKGGKSDVHAFQTEEVYPRNIYIDGVTNARDLGGYTVEGGKIKQGMLYRTAKLNKNHTDEPTHLITQKGIDTMLNTLKVKTEIDLRLTSDNEIGGLKRSVLGNSVKYVNCPMVADESMLTDNDQMIRKVFQTLADERNYPVFYHCSIGTDRTGYISFLILTLLGAEEEDVYRDYLYSNFGKIGGSRSTTNLSGFSLYLGIHPGKTRAEKAKNLLLDAGVTEKEINEIKRIMIE